MERGQVTPGLVGHGKGFRSYFPSDRKPLEGREQGPACWNVCCMKISLVNTPN